MVLDEKQREASSGNYKCLYQVATSRLKNEASTYVPKTALEAGCKSESPNTVMLNFMAEINMLIAWFQQQFWSLLQVPSFYNSPI